MRANAVLDSGQGGATGGPQLIHEAGQAAQGGHILGQAAGDPVRQLGAAGGMDALVVGQAGQQLLQPGGEGLLKARLRIQIQSGSGSGSGPRRAKVEFFLLKFMF
jgi:hypothetical protein